MILYDEISGNSVVYSPENGDSLAEKKQQLIDMVVNGNVDCRDCVDCEKCVHCFDCGECSYCRGCIRCVGCVGADELTCRSDEHYMA